MRRLALTAVVLSAMALLGLIVPWSASAETIDVGVTEVGWWSSNPIAIPQP